jgi:hypothetical protein
VLAKRSLAFRGARHDFFGRARIFDECHRTTDFAECLVKTGKAAAVLQSGMDCDDRIFAALISFSINARQQPSAPTVLPSETAPKVFILVGVNNFEL